LTLRGWHLEDAEAVYLACQDADIQRWIDIPMPFTRDDAVAFITEQTRQWSLRQSVGFAVTRSAGDIVLGSCTLGEIDATQRSANVTCALSPSVRGQGVAQHALRLLNDWAFHRLGLQRLEFYVEPDNAPSLHLVNRLNCKFEDPLPGAPPTTGRGGEQMLFVLEVPHS
jgi:RimJ/RimL family protein N-acetyltransferase